MDPVPLVRRPRCRCSSEEHCTLVSDSLYNYHSRDIDEASESRVEIYCRDQENMQTSSVGIFSGIKALPDGLLVHPKQTLRSTPMVTISLKAL